MATALAEQRPGVVAALALIDTGPSPDAYLDQGVLSRLRLAGLGLPVLVIFGTADKRWRSSSAAAYRDVPGARIELLPGVGHTPMLEDPQTTGTLLLRFALAMKEENHVCPR